MLMNFPRLNNLSRAHRSGLIEACAGRTASRAGRTAFPEHTARASLKQLWRPPAPGRRVRLSRAHRSGLIEASSCGTLRTSAYLPFPEHTARASLKSGPRDASPDAVDHPFPSTPLGPH